MQKKQKASVCNYSEKLKAIEAAGLEEVVGYSDKSWGAVVIDPHAQLFWMEKTPIKPITVKQALLKVKRISAMDSYDGGDGGGGFGRLLDIAILHLKGGAK